MLESIDIADKHDKENTKPSNIGISALARCSTDSLFVKSERPQSATSKIFTPRTEEMNKGFLMFSDEQPGLTSKYSFHNCLFMFKDFHVLL